MTLTSAVAMTLPAIVLVPFGRRLIVRMFDPTVTRILVIANETASREAAVSALQGASFDVLHVPDHLGAPAPFPVARTEDTSVRAASSFDAACWPVVTPARSSDSSGELVVSFTR